MSRLVSRALLERFRSAVDASLRDRRLPWVYNQSHAWWSLGLREAVVVSMDYPNSRLMAEIGPAFQLVVYGQSSDLAELVRQPPGPVTFFTTQHRLPIKVDSAPVLNRVYSYRYLEERGLPPDVAEVATRLRASPHAAVHVRRGDYLTAHFDREGWFAEQRHYRDAIDLLQSGELSGDRFDVVVFSDDLDFVQAHAVEYGLDRIAGDVVFVRGNQHYRSIFDSYLMSLCPVIIGSVGNFAATTSLLADPPSTFVRARPGQVTVLWQRTVESTADGAALRSARRGET